MQSDDQGGAPNPEAPAGAQQGWLTGLSGCFLSKDTIEKFMATKPPIINEGDKPNRNACLHQWSYDLRLGKEAYLSSQKYLQHLDSDRDSIVIEPGEFALLMTYESVNIPRDCVAFISLRFSYALKGLINISGFHVDPGYEGKLVFSVYNAGPNPVVMRYLDPVFMIVFASLDK